MRTKGIAATHAFPLPCGGSKPSLWSTSRGGMNTMKCCVAIVACLAGTTALAAEHWAYRPVARPGVPEVRGDCLTGVDRFILAALEARGFRLNPQADGTTLIRRVSFDLVG